MKICKYTFTYKYSKYTNANAQKYPQIAQTLNTTLLVQIHIRKYIAASETITRLAPSSLIKMKNIDKHMLLSLM